MGITLYYIKGSPPARAVLLNIKALGLDVELKLVDLMKGEHLKPEFLKMNPQHTVPTLDDNGFYCWDSHAINAYLVTKYGKDDSLYPKDPQLRAVVDQRLHYNSSMLFARGRNMVYSILFEGATSVPEDKMKAAVESYEMLETLIGDKKWIAGDQMTIADFSCVASVTSCFFMQPVLAKLPKLTAWVERCKTQMVGYQEANQEGVDMMNGLLKAKMT